MTLQAIGWLGGIFLSICALPQAIKTYKTKSAGDLSWGFIGLWFGGEVFTLTYIVASDIKSGLLHAPLYLNYSLNIILLFYLIYAKFRYKKNCLPAASSPKN